MSRHCCMPCCEECIRASVWVALAPHAPTFRMPGANCTCDRVEQSLLFAGHSHGVHGVAQGSCHHVADSMQPEAGSRFRNTCPCQQGMRRVLTLRTGKSWRGRKMRRMNHLEVSMPTEEVNMAFTVVLSCSTSSCWLACVLKSTLHQPIELMSHLASFCKPAWRWPAWHGPYKPFPSYTSIMGSQTRDKTEAMQVQACWRVAANMTASPGGWITRLLVVSAQKQHFRC